MENCEIINLAQEKMEISLSAFKKDLQSIQTGQPQPAILENIPIKYYEENMPLSRIADISKKGPRTLIVTPWEEKMLNNIKKGIFESNIGVTPLVDGKCIRLTFPLMTEDSRKKLCTLVKADSEKTKVSIRNIRREASSKYKSCLKKKEISEDEEKKYQTILQNKVDFYVKKVDSISELKEKDLLSF